MCGTGACVAVESACGNGTCVAVEEHEHDSFRFSSTLGTDKGSVVYTRAEVSTFLAGVKAGEWDHLLTP